MKRKIFFVSIMVLSLVACSKSNMQEAPDFSGKILSKEPVENGLYAYVCPKTGALSKVLVAKNFNNAGDNLEITKNQDGTYSTDNITILSSKGQYLRLPVDVYAKTVSFVDMDLSEPDYFGTKADEPGKYGTFMAPFEVEIPEGVFVYTVEEINKGSLVLTESARIKANIPYIVFQPEQPLNAVTIKNENVMVSNTVSPNVSLTKSGYTYGLLTGVYAETLPPIGSYVLQSHSDKYGFYKVASHDFYVPANKCYLEYVVD